MPTALSTTPVPLPSAGEATLRLQADGFDVYAPTWSGADVLIAVRGTERLVVRLAPAPTTPDVD